MLACRSGGQRAFCNEQLVWLKMPSELGWFSFFLWMLCLRCRPSTPAFSRSHVLFLTALTPVQHFAAEGA